MTSARKHLATRWHISSSAGGGSILRCYCGNWESDPKATTYAQRDAHRAHRVEMGEMVALARPDMAERLKTAEAKLAALDALHPHTELDYWHPCKAHSILDEESTLNACPNCATEPVMGCPRCDDACEIRKILHPEPS